MFCGNGKRKKEPSKLSIYKLELLVKDSSRYFQTCWLSGSKNSHTNIHDERIKRAMKPILLFSHVVQCALLLTCHSLFQNQQFIQWLWAVIAVCKLYLLLNILKKGTLQSQAGCLALPCSSGKLPSLAFQLMCRTRKELPGENVTESAFPFCSPGCPEQKTQTCPGVKQAQGWVCAGLLLPFLGS